MSSAAKKAKVYAVRAGRKTGLFESWDDCKAQVDGFQGAVFKSFPTREAAMEYLGGPPPGTKRNLDQISGHIDKSVEGLPLTQPDLPISDSKRRKITSSSSTAAPHISPHSSSQRTYLVAYTDGACPGNGQAGAVAGVGALLYDAKGSKILEISEKLPLCSPQTNQRAEIYAVIRLLEEADPDVALEIRTDSRYVVNAMTDWVFSWKQKKWNVPVENKDLFQYLTYLSARRTGPLRWVHVRGHSGDVGNDAADALAVQGCQQTGHPTFKFKYTVPADYWS